MTTKEEIFPVRKDKQLPEWLDNALSKIESSFGLTRFSDSSDDFELWKLSRRSYTGKRPQRTEEPKMSRRKFLGWAIGAAVAGGIGYFLWRHGEEEEIVEIEKVVMTERGADIFKSFNYIFGEGAMEREGNPPEIKIRMITRRRTEDEIIETASKKKAQFDPGIFKEVCNRYNIQPLASLALMLWESRLDPNRVGPTDDKGLYQLVDETGISAMVGIVKDIARGMQSSDSGERDLCSRIWQTAITDNPEDHIQITERLEKINELDTKARRLDIRDRDELEAVRKSIQDKMRGLEDDIRDIVTGWYNPFDPNQNVVVGTWLQRDNLNRLTRELGRDLSPDEQNNFMFALHYTGWTNAKPVLRHGMTYDEFVKAYGDRALRIHDDSCRKFLGALMEIRGD